MANKLKMSKNLFWTVLFSLILIISLSCDREMFYFNINCDECYSYKPDSADLIVKISIDEENQSVPLVFYRGKIEEGIVEWIDTAYSGTLYLYSPVDEYYSIKAYYKRDGETIIAVDGNKLVTSLVTDVCENDCWIIKRGILDVRLK